MIKINLLPFRAARTKENIRRQVSIYLLSLVMVTSFLIYYNIILNSKVKTLTNNVDEITAEVARYEVQAKKVDAIKSKRAILEKKNDVIKDLQMNRYEPVRFLDLMTQAVIPDRMWFTELAEKESARATPKRKKKGKKGKKSPPPKAAVSSKSVTVKGIALDNKTIADFMTGLEGLSLFSSVRLINIEQIEIRNIKMKKFEITCKKAPLKQAPKGKGKVKNNAKS